MPAPAIGNSDFSADFLRGAQVGNMRAMQQERMMELRSQEAQRQLQERQLAQQIEQRSMMFARQQQQDDEDEAATRGFASLLKENIDHATAAAQMSAQETGEPVDPKRIQMDTLRFMLPTFASAHPRAAAGIAKVVTPLMQDETRLDVAETRATSRGASNEPFEPVIKQVIDPATGKPMSVLQKGPHSSQLLNQDDARNQLRARELGIREENIQRLQRKFQLSPVDVQEVKSIYKQIDAKREKLDGMPTESGMGPWKGPNKARLKLEAEIEGLRAQARHLQRTAEPADAAESETAAEGKVSGSLKLGQVITQGEKRYRYQGGDEKDPASYVEIEEGK